MYIKHISSRFSVAGTAIYQDPGSEARVTCAGEINFAPFSLDVITFFGKKHLEHVIISGVFTWAWSIAHTSGSIVWVDGGGN